MDRRVESLTTFSAYLCPRNPPNDSAYLRRQGQPVLKAHLKAWFSPGVPLPQALLIFILARAAVT
jgi:hypothetical protein